MLSYEKNCQKWFKSRRRKLTVRQCLSRVHFVRQRNLCIHIYTRVMILCLRRAPVVFMCNTPHTHMGDHHTHTHISNNRPSNCIAYAHSTTLWKGMLYKQFGLQLWCSERSRWSSFFGCFFSMKYSDRVMFIHLTQLHVFCFGQFMDKSLYNHWGSLRIKGVLYAWVGVLHTHTAIPRNI